MPSTSHRARRSAVGAPVATALALTLALATASPVTAADEAQRSPRPPSVQARTSADLVPSGRAGAQAREQDPGRVSSRVDEPTLVLGDPGASIVTDRETTPVAPGLRLTSFDRLDARGWIRGDVLVADLSRDTLSTGYLDPGTVADAAPLDRQARAESAVAAVNGDFFDIGASSAPLGVGVDPQQGLRTSAEPGHQDAVVVGEDGLGALAEVLLAGTVTTPGGNLPLAAVDSFGVPADGAVLFTPQWGDHPRASLVAGDERAVAATVTDGEVTSVGEPGVGLVAEGTVELVGRGAAASALGALQPGDTVGVSYELRSDIVSGPGGGDGQPDNAPSAEDPAGDVAVAVGGNVRLVADGEAAELDDAVAAPRTAVGFSADGRTMYLATVDGRQVDSRGMTLRETADLMVGLGADDALNLDGGGSSTLLAREPGTEDAAVQNAPSDGSLRPVPNGLSLLAGRGSGELTGFAVSPATELEDGYRVFPGLTRTVRAAAHDETYAPAEGRARWQVTPASAARVRPAREGHVEVTGRATGDAELGVRSGGVTGSLDLTVLGQLARLGTSAPRVGLGADGDTATVTVTGYDADGFSAPVEAGDLTVTGGEGVVEVTPSAEGSATFDLTASTGRGSAVLEVSVGGVTTSVAVTVGLDERVVADFSDAASWRWSGARSAGSVSPAPGRDGTPGLATDFDFTTSTGTRTSNARPPQPITLPGQPRSISLWVDGDGQGEWTAFSLIDGDGQSLPLYGPYITWTGWQEVEVPVPDGVTYPLTFTQFGAIETDPTAQYTGRLVYDDLSVDVPPDVEVPAPPVVEDPVVVTEATDVDAPRRTADLPVDDRPLRVAVMSDAQFTAADGSTALIEGARRTLREVVAAGPDVLVVGGDLVDTAYPEDLALARRVLEEEVGDDIPWYYVPGNHEIMGPGTIASFEAEFGEPYRVVDVQSTRLVLLNSAYGTLRRGGFEQIQMLRSALDDAATDDGVDGVVVMAHHPTDDPNPAAVSQLADRKEAELVEDWLGEFRADTGKGAAYVAGHAGVFSASSDDGVPYIVNGNSAKTPSAAPEDGGFTGWTMLGIDPSELDEESTEVVRGARVGRAERSTWLRAQFRPLVDDLVLDVPASLGVAAQVPAGATVVQGSREVPADWPVTADWDGARLHVGDPQRARPGDVAAYDPAEGRLVGLRPGTAEVTVTVNGTRRTQDVVVT